MNKWTDRLLLMVTCTSFTSHALLVPPRSFIISLIMHFLITGSLFYLCVATVPGYKASGEKYQFWANDTNRLQKTKLHTVEVKRHAYVRLIATQLMRAFNCYLDLITRSCDLALLETRFFLCVRKCTEKYEYCQKKKNTHRSMTTEKFYCSVRSPSETIFLWVLHAQKNCVSPD